MRALRIIGAVALFFVFPLGVTAAQGNEFHFNKTGGYVFGQATSHVIATDPGPTSCKKVAGFGSTGSLTSASLTFNELSYQECTLKTIFGDIPVTINFYECDFHFNGSGEFHLKCPAGGGPWTISGPGCTITLAAQTAKGIVYTNEGSGDGRRIQLHFSLTGLKYSYSGFTCGSGSGTTNGTYTGNGLLVALKAIWWS